MADDYSKLSDEELDNLIAGRVNAPAGQGTKAATTARAAVQEKSARVEGGPPIAEQIEPSAVKRGLAGMGGAMLEPVMGLAEKAQLAFPGEGAEGAANIKRVADERAQRRMYQRQLEETPAGQAGAFAGEVLPYVAAPARIPAQMAAAGGLGFLRGGPDRPTGIGSELMTSGARGGLEAATTGVLMKGAQLAGRGANAALGRFSDEGADALRTNAAAERLGLPSPTVGQLMPRSAMGKIESVLPGRDELIEGQAKALGSKMSKDIVTPEGNIADVGGVYLDEMKNAVQKRYQLAGEKYKAVDELVDSQGLGNLFPVYTARSVTATNSPGYTTASELLGRYGFDAAGMQGMKAADLGKLPLRFEDYHTMRVATNKALGALDRGIGNAERMGNAVPTENKAARKWLSDLKTALDSDAENWATRHAANAEAVGAYKDATAYYRDVVAPTILDNPLARKVASTRSGYPSGDAALRAATSTSGIPMVERLRPTMTPQGEDMTTVLRNLPEVAETLLSKTGTAPERQGALGRAVRATLSHPLAAAETAIGHVPGLESLSRSMLMKRLAASRDPLDQAMLGRMMAGGAQYPQGGLEQRAERVFGLR